VQNAVRGALGIEEFKLTCPEVNTPDHTPIRDYIDVLDIVDAHIAALKYLQEGRPSEIFNLGNGRGWSVKEIVNAVKKELGVEFPIKKGEARKGEYAEVYADPRKAEEIIGWKPQRGLSESILSLKKWYGRKPGGYSK
jgi:UDP-glucose 4-epimerase